MTYQSILKQAVAGVHVLWINRSDSGNKLNILCMDELLDALEAAAADPECGALVLTGMGENFCGGGELGDYRAKTPVEIRRFGESFIRLHTAITGLSKPVVAAVQGHALGGGFSLVEACDLAVAAEEATLGVPEILSGLAPMMALTGVMRTASRKRAMELALLGEPVAARTAMQLGLVNWVCRKEEVVEKAVEVAQRLARSNPTAIALCKRLHRDADALPYERQMERGLEMLIALLKSDNAREALSAREENRIPVWMRN